ncbi:MAG: hypothetical protein P8X55_02780 [Desulfosarcinaceae bacterium]
MLLLSLAGARDGSPHPENEAQNSAHVENGLQNRLLFRRQRLLGRPPFITLLGLAPPAPQPLADRPGGILAVQKILNIGCLPQAAPKGLNRIRPLISNIAHLPTLPPDLPAGPFGTPFPDPALMFRRD